MEWAAAAALVDADKRLRVAGSRCKLGAVNALAQRQLATQFDVEEYPTIVFFGASAHAGIRYAGALTAPAIDTWLRSHAQARSGSTGNGTWRKVVKWR